MTKELQELVKQYAIFKQVTPLQFPNDHCFERFMTWLERQMLMGSTSA